ncbi:MAG: peptidase M48, partial [Streptomyces sp.]|nr:peptidase M48 [Streptomyces sp.]
NVKSSKDPLMKLVTDIAGGAGDLGGRVRRGFGGFTTTNPKDETSRDTEED